MKILLIDDDKDLTNLIKNTLKKDYEIEVCNDASTINPNIFTNFNLLILDLSLIHI